MKDIIIAEDVYRFTKTVRDDDSLRHSFNRLSEKTFDGLSFEFWYQQGYWGDGYRPYALVKDGQVIANASVSPIRFLVAGKEQLFLQIGTVMTEESHRNKGLSSFLLERILEDWNLPADDIYLYANQDVLDFYPKFGFIPTEESQITLSVTGSQSQARKLAMNNPADVAILQEHYAQSNPYSQLTMIQNTGLLMFYCSQFLNDSIYYLPAQNAVAILEIEDDGVICYDIFGTSRLPLPQLLSLFLPAGSHTVALGFTPKNSSCGKTQSIIQTDDVLFTLAGSESILSRQALRFPLLSHT